MHMRNLVCIYMINAFGGLRRWGYVYLWAIQNMRAAEGFDLYFVGTYNLSEVAASDVCFVAGHRHQYHVMNYGEHYVQERHLFILYTFSFDLFQWPVLHLIVSCL